MGVFSLKMSSIVQHFGVEQKCLYFFLIVIEIDLLAAYLAKLHVYIIHSHNSPANAITTTPDVCDWSSNRFKM